MVNFQPEPLDAAVEAVLHASRPAPDPDWAEALERRLLPGRRVHRTSRFSLALAGGLTALALLLSLAGVGPLARNQTPVDARDDCRVVAVSRTERVPVLVRGADGAPRLIYRHRTVTRHVTRCTPPGAGGPGRER